MSKKHHKRTGNKHSRMSKDGVIWRQSAEEATLARKPYYNAFACGHGVHSDTKYNRAKEKRARKRNFQKGASRGSFLYCALSGNRRTAQHNHARGGSGNSSCPAQAFSNHPDPCLDEVARCR